MLPFFYPLQTIYIPFSIILLLALWLVSSFFLESFRDDVYIDEKIIRRCFIS